MDFVDVNPTVTAQILQPLDAKEESVCLVRVMDSAVILIRLTSVMEHNVWSASVEKIALLTSLFVIQVQLSVGNA